jgi:hypothetical protein
MPISPGTPLGGEPTLFPDLLQVAWGDGELENLRWVMTILVRLRRWSGLSVGLRQIQTSLSTRSTQVFRWKSGRER